MSKELDVIKNSYREIALPRGFSDRLPVEVGPELKLMEAFYKFSANYGFQPIHVAPVSFIATFKDNRDVSLNWTYRFQDKNKLDLVLNPDSLPPLLRLYANSVEIHPKPIRWSFCTPIFRYKNSSWEKRYRHHLGATLINAPDSIYFDYLIASMVADFLTKIVNIDVTLKINDFALWRAILTNFNLSYEEIQEILHNSRSLSTQEFIDAIEVKSKDPKLVSLLKSLANFGVIRPNDEIFLALKKVLHLDHTARIDYLQEYINMLSKHNRLTLLIDLFDFHAAPFHSGIAFKIISESKLPRIGDGGSNHSLGQSFHPAINSVYSIAMNLEGVAQLYASNLPQEQSIDIYVCMLEQSSDVIQLIEKLRLAGITVWEDTHSIKISKALKAALTMDAKLFMVLGEVELKDKSVKVKRLSTQLEKSINWEDLVSEIDKLKTAY